MTGITLPYRWTPRPYQARLWNYLFGGGGRAVVRWHRRSGKDEVFLHHTACAAHLRAGNYWYMLPEYSQARKSMWDAINPRSGKRRIDEAFPRELRKSVNEQEMKIVFHCGSTFQLVGSDNYNSLVGSPPIGLVFSEYALSNPAAWGYLMPIIEENGGWVGFNSTPRGNNHFKQMCTFAAKEPGWFYQALTADETDVYTPEQLDGIRRQMQSVHGEAYGESLFQQEYYVSFDAAIPGSFWADCIDLLQRRGHICEVKPDPALPVFTAWDLGFTDDTAIWFYQMFAGEIRVFDYHFSNGKSMSYYAGLLRAKAEAGGFRYHTHWLPHDARARVLAAGGKSIQQQLRDEDVGATRIAKRLDHQEGIQAARATFPYCWFDDGEDVEKGLNALRNYHREWDEEKQAFNHTPVHDWSSHGASAFRTLALSWKAPKEPKPDEPDTVAKLMKTLNPTFGHIKREFLRKRRTLRLYN